MGFFPQLGESLAGSVLFGFTQMQLFVMEVSEHIGEHKQICFHGLPDTAGCAIVSIQTHEYSFQLLKYVLTKMTLGWRLIVCPCSISASKLCQYINWFLCWKHLNTIF